MARLIEPSDKALRIVARQIGARLYDEFERREGELPDFDSSSGIGNLSSDSFEMGETFEIWHFRPGATDQLAHTREDLVTLARPSGAWHHQIRVVAEDGEKRAVAFAQSWPGGLAGTEWSVRDLFFSTLAADIDQAITLADEWFAEEAIVRLLSLPEYKIETLWFLGVSADVEPPRPTSQVIVVTCPPSFAAREMSLMSSRDFIRALAETRLGMGLLI